MCRNISFLSHFKMRQQCVHILYTVILNGAFECMIEWLKFNGRTKYSSVLKLNSSPAPPDRMQNNYGHNCEANKGHRPHHRKYPSHTQTNGCRWGTWISSRHTAHQPHSEPAALRSVSGQGSTQGGRHDFWPADVLTPTLSPWHSPLAGLNKWQGPVPHPQVLVIL